MSISRWQAIGPVEVVYRDLSRLAYPTLADALLHVGHHILSACSVGRIGDRLPVGRVGAGRFLSDLMFGDPVEFRDELGMLVPLWRVREEALRIGLERRRARPWWARPKPHVFRHGPVPGIHKRGGYGSWYRAMRTTQEIRETLFLDGFDEDAGEHGVRVRRRRCDLPTWYDDKPRRGKGRTWKAHRRTRWKA